MRLRTIASLVVVLAACSSSSSGGNAAPSNDAGSGNNDAGSVNPVPISDAGSGDDTTDAGDAATESGTPVGNILASCSKASGCLADCAAPANDPIATGKPEYDLYDGCILAATQLAGLTETWQQQLFKSQAMQESGLTPSIEPSTSGNACGGQNCGQWAISAGAVSGDSPPGPCGSSATDPATGTKDYSHSYGLFQSTPACEGTFLTAALPTGVTCTGTTTVDDIPFASGTNRFYCESATSIGVTDLEGHNAQGFINAWQDKTSALYATSVFNPAYQIYMYVSYTWKFNFIAANAKATGCTTYQQWYLALAFWLTGNATTTCTTSGAGLSYVNGVLSNYKTLYGQNWPNPAP